LQPRTDEQKLHHRTYRIATLYVSDCKIVHIALQPVDTLTDEQKLRLKEYKAFKEEQDKYLKALNTERTKLLSEVAKIKTTLDERIDELYNKRTKEVTLNAFSPVPKAKRSTAAAQSRLRCASCILHRAPLGLPW
jgi:hypothetical protein